MMGFIKNIRIIQEINVLVILMLLYQNKVIKINKIINRIVHINYHKEVGQNKIIRIFHKILIILVIMLKIPKINLITQFKKKRILI
jgi:hypothetical protein